MAELDLSVISTVIAEARKSFQDSGLDQATLLKLEGLWKKKLLILAAEEEEEEKQGREDDEGHVDIEDLLNSPGEEEAEEVRVSGQWSLHWSVIIMISPAPA